MEDNTNTQPDSTAQDITPSTPTPTAPDPADDNWTFDPYVNDSVQNYDSKEFDEGFMVMAKENKLTKEQAVAIRKTFLDKIVAEELSESKAARDKQERDIIDLQNAWGGQYKFKVGQINKLLLQMDGGNQDGPVHKYIAESGLDSDTRFVKFMDSIVSLLGKEDDTQISKRAAVTSAENVQAEINKLMRDPAYFDAGDPAHDSVVKQVQSLYERLYSD